MILIAEVRCDECTDRCGRTDEEVLRCVRECRGRAGLAEAIDEDVIAVRLEYRERGRTLERRAAVPLRLIRGGAPKAATSDAPKNYSHLHSIETRPVGQPAGAVDRGGVNR